MSVTMRLSILPTIIAACRFSTENVDYASKEKRGGLLNLGRSYHLIVSREHNTAHFGQKALFQSNNQFALQLM
jgi:hypothetical protein